MLLSIWVFVSQSMTHMEKGQTNLKNLKLSNKKHTTCQRCWQTGTFSVNSKWRSNEKPNTNYRQQAVSHQQTVLHSMRLNYMPHACVCMCAANRQAYCDQWDHVHGERQHRWHNKEQQHPTTAVNTHTHTYKYIHMKWVRWLWRRRMWHVEFLHSQYFMLHTTLQSIASA